MRHPPEQLITSDVYFGSRLGVPSSTTRGKGAWDQFPAPIHHFRHGTPRNSWYEGTRPKYDRQSTATATAPDDRIYLVAGVGHPIPQKVGEYDGILSSVEVFDPATNDWSEAPPLQRARQMNAAAFGPDGKLYVFGGCACLGTYDASDAPEAKRKALIEQLEGRRSVKEVEVYDPATRTWSMRSPMPTPRQLLAAATGADGKIYVIGGSLSYAAPGTDVVEVYDPATDSWSRGPSLGIARKGHTASVTPDGRVWVVGGLGAGRSPLDPREWLPGGETHGPLDSVETLATGEAP
jgi:N-acetylneuraminic acid mutarotase